MPAPKPAPPPTGRAEAANIIRKSFSDVTKAAGTVDGLGPKFDFAGWLIGTISGTSESNSDYDTIKQQLDVGRQQLDQLQKTLSYTCKTAQESRALLKKVVTNTTWAKIEPKFAAIEQVIGSIETSSDWFNEIMNDQDATAPGTPLSAGDQQLLGKTREQSLRDMNTLATLVAGTPGNKDSVAELYAAVIEDSLSAQPHSVPSETGIYFTDYLHPLYDEINFYAAAASKNMNLLAESYHGAAAANQAQLNKDVAGYLTQGSTAISSWYAKAAPTGSDIPDGTFVDTREAASNGVATMWSESPVAVDSQDPSSYCYVATSFCFENVYTADHQIVSSRLVPTTPGPMPSLGGFTDWTLPTLTDYTDLAKGSSGGLASYFGKLGVDALSGRTITSHLNGQDSSVSVLGPLLTRDTSNSDGKVGVVHWMSSQTDKTPADQWTFTTVADQQNQLAGQVFMTREYVLSGGTGASSRSADPVTIGARQPHPPAPTATLGDPVVFRSPTDCGKGTTYTVPDGANAIQIAAVGGQGGSGKFTTKNTVLVPGGRGGEVINYVPVVPGTVLQIQVGADGGDTQAGSGGGGTGGATINGYSPNHAGGGGGASGVSADSGCTQWLAVGAGGGGGGSGWGGFEVTSFTGGKGGDACAASTGCTAPGPGGGDHGVNASGGAPGSPPPHNAGAGAPLPASPGSARKGGNGSDGSRSGKIGGGAGGGGGAGYFGGGGGGGGGIWGGGGGGAGGANLAIDADQNGTGVSVVADEGQQAMVIITPLASMSTPVALTTSVSSIGYGDTLTLAATLPLDATGTVTFLDASQPGSDKSVGTAEVVHGVAVLTDPNPTLDIGSHSITAAYDGNARYQPADSNAITVAVVKEAPKVTLSVSRTRVDQGDAISLTAAVTPLTATGYMAFYDHDQPGPDAGIGLAKIGNDGVAVLSNLTKPLVPGNNHFTAYYNADQVEDGKKFTDASSNEVVIYVQASTEASQDRSRRPDNSTTNTRPHGTANGSGPATSAPSNSASTPSGALHWPSLTKGAGMSQIQVGASIGMTAPTATTTSATAPATTAQDDMNTARSDASSLTLVVAALALSGLLSGALFSRNQRRILRRNAGRPD